MFSDLVIFGLDDEHQRLIVGALLVQVAQVVAVLSAGKNNTRLVQGEPLGKPAPQLMDLQIAGDK